MDDILQMTCSNMFKWTFLEEIMLILSQFLFNLFLGAQPTKTQPWIRSWPGSKWWQAITGVNDDQLRWRINVSIGLNKLINFMCILSIY